MKKILFVSQRLDEKKKNGAYIVAKRNFENLKSIYGDRNIRYFNIAKKTRLNNLFNKIVLGRAEGITRKEEEEILEIIENEAIEYLFLDTCNFGFLTKKIKNKFKNNIKIIVFCHDIGKGLYISLMKKIELNQYSFKDKIERIKNKYILRNCIKNEGLSFKNSDLIITLNKRDSEILLEEYKIKSNIEIPVTFPLPISEKKLEVIFKKEKFSLLFVGAAGFLPNMHGLEFFINKVLPELDVKLYIVGKNMENYKEKFKDEKIEVIGTVDSLDKYYLNADAVIAPIFLGGGMKVKTAEALMYGKTIFGTTEAFEGYELDYNKVGGLCNNAQEFIEKINKHIKNYNGLVENKYSKNVFMEKYSYEASKKLFQKILGEL